MKKLILDIIDYTKFLKKEFGLSLSFIYDHFPQKYFELLLPYISHDNNEYCEYYKKYKLMCCVQDKFKLLEKNIQRIFIGRCHAGVRQLIIPVKADNNKTVNLIMISEHRSFLSPDFENLSQHTLMSAEIMEKKYNTLPFTRHKIKDIETKINPLVHMLELYYLYSKDYDDRRANVTSNQKVYEEAANYILMNVNNNLTLQDVCKYCNYSSTFLNLLFKHYRDMTITQYIIYLKMKKAAQLLLTTDKSISEISGTLGYNDSNYFSNQFKKNYKVSPTIYRKNG